MSDNNNAQTDDRQSVVSKGRLFTFLIALFLIIFEILYYVLLQGDSKNLEFSRTFFIPKFIMEPFTFLTTWLGTINIYTISLPVLGLILAFLAALFASLSLLTKKKPINLILNAIAVIIAVLYISLMILNILPFSIGFIFMFLAIGLVAFNFPYRKAVIIGLITLGWLTTGIVANVSPYLDSKEITTFSREYNYQDLTEILGVESDTDEVVSIEDAIKNSDKNIDINNINEVEAFFEEKYKNELENNNFDKDMISLEKDENGNFLFVEKPEATLILRFDEKVSGTIHIVDAMQTIVLEKKDLLIHYIENRGIRDIKEFIDKELIVKVEKGESFGGGQLKDDIKDVINKMKNKNIVLADSMGLLQEKDVEDNISNYKYADKKLDHKKQPEKFKPFSIEFPTYSKVQIINIKNLKPYTKYWYYIESYNNPYGNETKMINILSEITDRSSEEYLNDLNKIKAKNDRKSLIEFRKDLIESIVRYYDFDIIKLSDYIRSGVNIEKAKNIIEKFGGTVSESELATSLSSLREDNKTTKQYSKQLIKHFGGKVLNKGGFKYVSLNNSFYTETRTMKDEKPPYLVDTQIYVEPLDIDYSNFINKNYDKIVNGIKQAKKQGQYTVYLGELWGIKEGETGVEIIKSAVFYDLLQKNAEKLIKDLPEKGKVTKEDADRFMNKIKAIIRSQRSEPNLAEDLKIPAYIKMKLKFTEKATGTLAINIEKNKEPLRTKKFEEPSYIWETEFGLMDYQYQGVLYVNPENFEEYAELRTDLQEIRMEVEEELLNEILVVEERIKEIIAEAKETITSLSDENKEKLNNYISEAKTEFTKLIPEDSELLKNIMPKGANSYETKVLIAEVGSRLENIISQLKKNVQDISFSNKKERLIKAFNTHKEEMITRYPTYKYLLNYINNDFYELFDEKYKLTAKTFEITPYIKEYEKDKVHFNIEAFRLSALKPFLERKYSFELQVHDKFNNIGKFALKDDEGIQTNVSTPDISHIINIVVIFIILAVMAIYFILNVINMKKKFMLKESLPPFLANLGILLLLINIIASLFLKLFPVQLEFFFLMLIAFFLLSEQGWALKISAALSGSIILIGLISALVAIFPEFRTSFTPPINPEVPKSFFIVSELSIITHIFIYIIGFSCATNMLNNNLGLDRNKSLVVSLVVFVIAIIISVISGILSINLYNNLGDGSLYRNISFIAGSGAVGILIGTLIPGEWGKGLGRILFILLGIGFIVIMIFGFVPFKFPAIILLAVFLIIGTTWARTVSLAYFFVQMFILLATFIILIPDMSYPLVSKVLLLLMALAYLAVGIFNMKSTKVRDYSEGKL